jgi:hypothetical protein
MSASVHGDEDGVGQVKMETMTSLHLAEAGGRVKEEGEDVMLGGRLDTCQHRGFYGFVLKTIGGGRVWSTLLASGLVVWASKLSVAGLRV